MHVFCRKSFFMLAKGMLPACGAMLVLIASATASERSAQLIESFNDFLQHGGAKLYAIG